MTTADVRYDAGPHAGLGHHRRAEALACALRQAGVQVTVEPVGAPADGDVVVVDSYAVRADELGSAGAVVAIEDLGRDQRVDLLVDPNPGSEPGDYRAAKRTLLGPRYALIDPTIDGMVASPIGERAAVALVAVGGADPDGLGATIARTLAQLLPDAEVRLAVGPWSDEGDVDGIVAVRTSAGLADHLAASDVVITAGGVTLLESLALGRPTVVMVVADNQRRAADWAVDAGAAVGSTPEEAAATAAELASDPARRRQLGDRARSVVDARGAARVAEEILTLA